MLFCRNSAKYIPNEYIWVIPQDYFPEESNYVINHCGFFSILSSCEKFSLHILLGISLSFFSLSSPSPVACVSKGIQGQSASSASLPPIGGHFYYKVFPALE